MPLFRAQIILPYFTGTPTDVSVNQLHFLFDTNTGLEPAAVASHCAAFYDDIYPAATAASRANYIDWPLAHVKVFDLSQPTPRVPWVFNLGYANAGTAATPIPTEVATVLSFHAEPESGVRFQRLYNRIFLPMAGAASSMANSAVDAFPTLSTGWVTLVRNAAIALHAAANNTTVGQWSQVSNATGLTAVRPIVGGWVDNSPDTQRRRSVLASSRNTW